MTVRSDQIEMFENGIQRFWINERILVIKTQGDMSIAAIDTWARVVVESYHSYPPESPAVFVLHNLSHPNQRITTYSRQKTEEIYRLYNIEREIYAAVVLKDSILGQLATIFMRMWGRPYPNMHQRVFTSQDAAVEWLQSMIKAHG